MSEQESERLRCIIRPVRPDDVEPINEIRRQPGVAEFTNAFPSERLEQNRGFIEQLGPDDHMMVAEVDGRVVAWPVCTSSRESSAIRAWSASRCTIASRIAALAGN